MRALCGLAYNPALPPQLLERLIALDDWDLDRYLAGRGDLTPAQADLLATRSKQVMMEVNCKIEPPTSAHEKALQQASDPATPPDVVAELVRDQSVRHVVARRADLPQWAFELLAKDLTARRVIAQNPAVPEIVLRELVAKSDRETRRIIVQNPSIPLDLLIELAPLARTFTLPRVASASVAELRTLASSRLMQVRRLAAYRHDLPADVLTILLGDPEPEVRAGVAANPALSASQLEDLAAHGDPRILARIAQNPHCTPELLHRLARTGGRTLREIVKHPHASAETLLLCLRDKEARRLAASRPDLPVPALVELLSDPYAAFDAAANPVLPVSEMEKLLTG